MVLTKTKPKKKRRPGEVTRKRLVDVARRLFLQQGYEATGIAQILKQSGVNSGSLYYFFRTKEDLLLAVLDWYLENLHSEVIDPAKEKTSDPIERVFAVMDGYRQMLTATHCRMGCPIGNLALEMGDKSAPVRRKIAQNFANWCEAIRALLEPALGRLPPGTNLGALATFCLTVMEGGVMQARATGDVSGFDNCVALLRDYFERLTGRKPATVG